jgi:sugar lactone lactonase YvrE
LYCKNNLKHFKESVEQLYSSINLLGKQITMFANDFDFINNDTIVFTDVAAGCPLSELLVCCYGGTKTSRFACQILKCTEAHYRLIQFNLRTQAAKALLEDQFGLNGVQLHSDKQSVLVAQSLLSRILRYYFAGPKRGKVEVFADGLPGLPDNIRPSR